MAVLSFTIDDELHQALQRVAKEHSENPVDICRKALVAYLAVAERKEK